MSANIRSSSNTALAALSTPFAITLTKPAGVIDGDELIAVVMCFGGNRSISTVPSGWTLVTSQNVATSDLCSVYKKTASGEPASWTWNASGITVGGGGVIALIDYDATTPVDISAVAAAAATTTPSFANTVTPARDNELLIMFVSAGNGRLGITDISGYAIVTSNPTWIELFDLNYSSVSSYDLGVAYAIRPAVTATGNSSAVIGGGISPYGSGCIIIGVKRTLAYAPTVKDTEVMTDNETVIRNRVATIKDTEVMTDSAVAVVARTWTTLTKHVSTWLNQFKN